MAQPQEIQREPLDKQVDHTLQEARMVLPGVQALFGFQLMAVFNPRFAEALSAAQQRLHLWAVVLVAVSVALIMSPAAYHRQAEPEQVSSRLRAYGSRMLALAMAPLAAATALDLYLVAQVITHDTRLAAAIAASVGAFFVVFWYVVPLARRATRHARQ